MAVQKVLIDTDGLTQIYPITQDVCVFDSNGSTLPNVYIKASDLKTINNQSLINPGGGNIVIEGGSGGGSGTSNYEALTNKPSINSVELTGNKSLDTLGIQAKLTSGTNIKSLSDGTNTSSLLGSGSITFKTVNNSSIIGSGNISISGGTSYSTLSSSSNTNTSYVVKGAGSNTSYYLRGDGNWAAVSGGGGTSYDTLSSSSNTNTSYVVKGAGSNTSYYLRGDGNWAAVSGGSGVVTTYTEISSTTPSISIDGKNYYKCTNPVTSLTLTIPATQTYQYDDCTIEFTTDSTFANANVTYPNGLRFSPLKPYFSASKSYLVSIVNNILVVGEIVTL